MLSAKVIDVTPEMAKVFLDRSRKNRSISEAWVEDLARYMKEGLFEENGEPIIFNGEDRLIDGQHRLMAVVKSKKTIPFLVVRGASENAATTVDTGRPRSLNDALKIIGEKNTSILASTLRFILDYDLASETIPATAQNHNYRRYTLAEALKKLEEYPEIRESAAEASKSAGFVLIKSLRAVFHHIFGRMDKTLRDEFFDVLDHGLCEDEGHPVRRLREMLIRNNQRPLPMRLPRKVILAYIVKAWNFLVIGDFQTQIKWGYQSQFPQLIDPRKI